MSENSFEGFQFFTVINLTTTTTTTVCRPYPLLVGGEVGEREGQLLLTGGSSSSSSSDELSRVRSITSTFLLPLPFEWELERSGAEVRHPPDERRERRNIQFILCMYLYPQFTACF